MVFKEKDLDCHEPVVEWYLRSEVTLDERWEKDPYSATLKFWALSIQESPVINLRLFLRKIEQ